MTKFSAVFFILHKKKKKINHRKKYAKIMIIVMLNAQRENKILKYTQGQKHIKTLSHRTCLQ